MPNHVLVIPEVLLTAAAQFDAVADHLEATVNIHSPLLTVYPSGREEVSASTSRSFNAVADGFRPAAAKGIAELREAAIVLRAQAKDYSETDTAFGDSLLPSA